MPPEAQTRDPDPSLGGHAIDQSARTAEANLSVDIIKSADEVVEDMRAQMDELDASVAAKTEELDRERAARAAADRRAQDAESRARDADRQARQATETAGRSVESAQLDAIKNALATHEGHLKNLAAQKATALTEGDFTKAADYDAEMAKTGGRIAQLESGRDELDARIKTPPADAGRQVDQPARQDTPDERRETFIRQQPPRIQDWLRSDKGARYFTDTVFAQKVAAAASYAQTIKNLPIDSQAYLDYVEEQVGLRQAADDPPARRDDRAPSTPGQGRSADAGQRMTTAPAGGANDGSVRRNANGTIDVYLTREEKEQAGRDGLTEAEYAKAKRDLIAEGLIGPGARVR